MHKIACFFFVAFSIFTTRAFAQDTSQWYRYVNLNGLIMGSTTYNFDHPRYEQNQYRVFDVDANSLQLDLLALTLQHHAAVGEAGFRTDVAVGPFIPKVIHSAGLEGGVFDVDQAYLTYVIPIGAGMQVDAGKFITPVGFEYIERFDGQNWNASHSFLFGYAIPFTHTGARVTYSFDSTLSVLAMLVNGWDNTLDNNKAKTIGGQVTWIPSSAVNLALGAISGPEMTNDDQHNRLLLDFTGSVNIGSHLSLGVNGDYGTEQNHLIGTRIIDSTLPGDSGRVGHQEQVPVPLIGSAVWKGVAVYVRAAVSDAIAFNLRGEVFDDLNAVRTGTAQTLREITLTPEWRPNAHWMLRGDIRVDNSSAQVFDHKGIMENFQTTASVNAVYAF